jgi:hypothetical protein
MRFLPTRVHGMIDYGVGALMVATPWIFGFARGGAETWIFVILGLGAIVYSLFTDYELGLAKKISVPAHLVLDALSGILLAVSPWIFGFSDYIFAPHLIFGLFEIGASLITQKYPHYQRTATDAGHH